MGFEITSTRTRALLDERPTFDEALDVAQRVHARPGRDVTITGPSGLVVAFVWHDYTEIFGQPGNFDSVTVA